MNDLTSQLNHPVAVVAIIGSLIVMIREVSWMIRSAKGKGNPYYDTQKILEATQKSNEKFTETLVSINTSLLLMNSKMERIDKATEKTLDEVYDLSRRRHT